MINSWVIWRKENFGVTVSGKRNGPSALLNGRDAVLVIGLVGGTLILLTFFSGSEMYSFSTSQTMNCFRIRMKSCFVFCEKGLPFVLSPFFNASIPV